VEPFVRIQGWTEGAGDVAGLGQEIGGSVVAPGDMDGDGSIDLVVSSGNPYEHLFLYGPFERGIYQADDLALGRLSNSSPESIAAAGDANNDGLADVWLGQLATLQTGPVYGHRYYWEDYQAHFPNLVSEAMGGMDADGDGHMDVVVAAGTYFTVYYGPFEGELYGGGEPGYDPSQVTEFVDGCASSWAAHGRIIRDYPDPGDWLYAPPDGYLCSFQTMMVDIRGPRGRILRFPDDVVTWSRDSPVRGAADFNGDGRTDFIDAWVVTDQPIGVYNRDDREHIRFVGSGSRFVGDMNRDGLPEMLIPRASHRDGGMGMWIVPGGDYRTDNFHYWVEDIDDAVMLWDRDDDVFLSWDSDGAMALADIDGDGRDDFIVGDNSSNGNRGGEVRIYLAAELYPWD